MAGKKKEVPTDDLRQKAEQEFSRVPEVDGLSAEDVKKLVHELRVHQIELEMQNDMLRESQVSLEESRARYTDLYDFAPVGYVTLDAKGVVLEANLTAAKQLGIVRSRLIGRPFATFVAKEDRDRFRLHLSGLFKVVRQRSFETRLVRTSDGVSCIALLQSIIVINERVSKVCRISISDISDRKAVEEALRDSKRLLDKTFAALDDAVFVVEPSSRTILSCNPAVERIFGYREEELIGRNFELLHVDRAMYDQFGTELFAALEATGAFRTEFRMMKKDGTVFPAEHTVTEILDDSGRRTMVVSAIRDISKQLEAKRAIGTYMTKLEQSNQALRDFASIASHDMQEPLRKIVAFADRLKKHSDKALDVEGHDYLERMRNAARRMQALLSALLEYSRAASRPELFAPVDLDILVRDVLDDLELRIQQSGGSLEVAALPVIEADSYQMQQLFQNLVNNSLKFHGDNKPVIRIRSELLNDGQLSQIVIEDNGIGFEEKHLERMFAPFQRLHGRSAYEGIGMGLAICRKIVERHNGAITAKSTPGKGSTFVVTLPVRQRRAETPDASRRDTPSTAQ